MMRLAAFILGVLVSAMCMVHAEIRKFSVTSACLATPERVVVAVPDAKAPAKGWPTLYLLNGYLDNEEAWIKCLPLDSLANANSTIIICPDGRDSFYWDVDESVCSGLKMERFITRDLVAMVDSMFATDKASRSIAGYSMGGHGALYLAARHPGMFKNVVALSGAFDIERLKAVSWIKVPSLLGPYDRRRWNAASVFAHMDSLAAHAPRIMLICGAADAFLPDSKRLHAEFDRLGVKHVYKVLPGDHHWRFWRKQMPALFDFINSDRRK